MKSTLILLAAFAATIGTAAAQGSNGIGTSGHASNGNNTVSGGNSTGTSSSASNSNPTTSAPNYKPAPGNKPTAQSTTKAAPKASSNQLVRSGGQGHNSTPDPKGKILVAPSEASKGSKK